MRCRTASSARLCGSVASPSASATSRAESSTRLHVPSASVAIRRPPTANAASPTITPLSISASLVVPPPISTCRMHCRRSLRQPHRARAVRRQPAFQPVAGGGADEFSGFCGEQLVDRARILSLDRLAGQDHGAGIDLVALEAGRMIGVMDEMAETMRVDRPVGQERREHDRRAPHDLPIDHREAAGQPLRLALQHDLGEQQMRGRAADVDADRRRARRSPGSRCSARFPPGPPRSARVLVQEVGVVHACRSRIPPASWLGAAPLTIVDLRTRCA